MFGPIVRRSCRFCDWYYDDEGPPPVFDWGADPMTTVAHRRDLHKTVVERILSGHIAQHVDEMCEP